MVMVYYRESSVQSLSHVWLFATTWAASHQASLSLTNSWSLLKLMSIKLVMASNHVILCHFLYLPSIFPSIRVSSNELALCIRWPNYWSFSFSISYSHAYSELSCFGTDWFDHPVVQGTLKSLPQHHSSKSSIFRCSAFFMVQLSSVHNYWKNHSLTIWTFISKVMSLLFSTLSRFVIALLPKSKCLLISWLQLQSAVI